MNAILKLSFVSIAIIALASCGGNTDEAKLPEIKKDTIVVNSGNCEAYYKDALHFDSILLKATNLNKQVGETAVNAFNKYASECKNDSLAPMFLIKAGQVAQSIGNYTQAQILLKKCADEFPNFKNRGAALFLLAQLYDDVSMLNNEAEAKTMYQQIIKEYPNSAWERDSKASLNNLGKTDEQLIQEFLKKNK